LREEVKKELKRLRNERLCDLCISLNTIRMIKSIRMKWVGHVARVRESRDAYRVLVGKLSERDHLEDLSLDGRIVLKWVFKKCNVWHRLR
jgi:hypothetical protein